LSKGTKLNPIPARILKKTRLKKRIGFNRSSLETIELFPRPTDHDAPKHQDHADCRQRQTDEWNDDRKAQTQRRQQNSGSQWIAPGARRCHFRGSGFLSDRYDLLVKESFRQFF
jgi:hypothetical protein